ncbi:hypothetical protein GJV07_02640 [Enterobacteriaceae bacterium RIT711]|nr:hypothetical protein [Enterobacteriaceae bacterium RIT711]
MFNDERLRDFKIVMESVTRKGNPVCSVYYIAARHILTARDIALKTATKRGFRKIRVSLVTDLSERD